MVKFPHFHSKKAWTDSDHRQWFFPGRLPEWELMNDFNGIACFILDRNALFPEEGVVVRIVRGADSALFRLDEIMDVSKNGFKCLALVSEV